MKLSIILVAYDMAREIPRTLQSLSRHYQQRAQDLDYEVLLVDNGSPAPLDPASWGGIDVPVQLLRIDNAPRSPAQAINLAFARSSGDITCLMIDGAHLLTPGVFRLALSCYEAFDDAVVAVRFFYLGMEEQTVSVAGGYDRAVEDQLLERIEWPRDGYRLFEIATPLRSGAARLAWMNRMFESNCLFMRRGLFCALGGADERFDLPGGGLLNLDIFKRAVESPGVTPVQLIGEGTFHQLHGGTSTNSSGGEREARLRAFREQYRALRGNGDLVTHVPFMYMGHMPTRASNISAVERRRARQAGRPLP